MRKRFKFIKDCQLSNGSLIKMGCIIDIIGQYIFMYDNTTQGGQILDTYMYNLLHDFIEREVKQPNYLQEIPVPYNKC